MTHYLRNEVLIEAALRADLLELNLSPVTVTFLYDKKEFQVSVYIQYYDLHTHSVPELGKINPKHFELVQVERVRNSPMGDDYVVTLRPKGIPRITWENNNAE